ncbi:hypothetical protein FACS1894133_1160 [Clostridia bacterium]|nr:hypothetical protein FACS1894133_1160 [Clostridia bacterium]
MCGFVTAWVLNTGTKVKLVTFAFLSRFAGAFADGEKIGGAALRECGGVAMECEIWQVWQEYWDLSSRICTI